MISYVMQNPTYWRDWTSFSLSIHFHSEKGKDVPTVHGHQSTNPPNSFLSLPFNPMTHHCTHSLVYRNPKKEQNVEGISFIRIDTLFIALCARNS